FLVWLGHHARIRPWSLFALYVAGYSGYRIFEETIRGDSSVYILGLRLNLVVAVALTVIGLVWFYLVQRRPERPYTVLPPGVSEAAGAAEASPDEAAPDEAAAEGVAADGHAAAGDPAQHGSGPSPTGTGEPDNAGMTATRSED